jgi:hypothetical protein
MEPSVTAGSLTRRVGAGLRSRLVICRVRAEMPLTAESVTRRARFRSYVTERIEAYRRQRRSCCLSAPRGDLYLRESRSLL